MNVQAEKAKIKQLSTPRTTTTRVIQILALQGIEVDRRALWEWMNTVGRLAEYDPEIIQAYWKAIAERTEKFQKLAVPEKQRAMKAAKKLVAEAA